MITDSECRSILMSSCPELHHMLSKSYDLEFPNFFELARIKDDMEWVVAVQCDVKNEVKSKRVIVRMETVITIEEI